MTKKTKAPKAKKPKAKKPKPMKEAPPPPPLSFWEKLMKYVSGIRS